MLVAEPRNGTKAPFHGCCQTDNLRAVNHMAHLLSFGKASHVSAKKRRVKHGNILRQLVIDQLPLCFVIVLSRGNYCHRVYDISNPCGFRFGQVEWQAVDTNNNVLTDLNWKDICRCLMRCSGRI